MVLALFCRMIKSTICERPVFGLFTKLGFVSIEIATVLTLFYSKQS